MFIIKFLIFLDNKDKDINKKSIFNKRTLKRKVACEASCQSRWR